MSSIADKASSPIEKGLRRCWTWRLPRRGQQLYRNHLPRNRLEGIFKRFGVSEVVTLDDVRLDGRRIYRVVGPHRPG